MCLIKHNKILYIYIYKIRMIECTGIIKVLTPPLYIYIYIYRSIDHAHNLANESKSWLTQRDRVRKVSEL